MSLSTGGQPKEGVLQAEHREEDDEDRNEDRFCRTKREDQAKDRQPEGFAFELPHEEGTELFVITQKNQGSLRFLLLFSRDTTNVPSMFPSQRYPKVTQSTWNVPPKSSEKCQSVPLRFPLGFSGFHIFDFVFTASQQL